MGRKNGGLAKPRRYILPILIALSAVLPVVSLTVGFYGLSAREVFAFLFRGAGAVSENAAIVIANIRIPRVIAAYLIGAGLAAAGVGYQGAFRNPLVSENIIGASHGASLGAALGLLLRLNSYMVQMFAFSGGVVTVLIAYFIGTRARFHKDVSLILAGSMLSAMANAAITAIKYVADPNDTLPAITYWLMGSFSKVNGRSLLYSAVPILAGMTVLFLLRWRLNILTMGEEEAMSMGVNPPAVRGAAILASTVISAAAVCIGGQIGWVGLMVPHMARGMVGSDHRRALPVAALTGGCFLLIMDNIARSVSTMELPIGVLTAVFGAPFFVLLLLKRRR